MAHPFSENHVRAIFLLSGIPILSIHEITNKYWPKVPDYDRIRIESPWFLVGTSFGLIEIGWRKRVISIDWTHTNVRKIVTSDDVTKDSGFVHAWSYLKAVEYMTNFADPRFALKPKVVPA